MIALLLIPYALTALWLASTASGWALTLLLVITAVFVWKAGAITTEGES